MTTSYNRIKYYVGDRFIDKYRSHDEIKNVRKILFFLNYKLEYYIEREYLNVLAQKCNTVLQFKNELEIKLSYYRNSPYIVKLKQEYDNLDFSKCKDYNIYKNVRILFYFS